MSHNSMHWTNDRAERNAVINMLGGVGNPIFEAVVDKGHPAGPERHIVTDNAIITIKNLYTNKMVTHEPSRIPGRLSYREMRGNFPSFLFCVLCFSFSKLYYNIKNNFSKLKFLNTNLIFSFPKLYI